MSYYAAFLQPFLPYIPPGLISANCLDGVRSVTQHLPAALGINPFMLECSLDSRPVADFSVMALASRGDPVRLGSMDEPRWRCIQQFARSWADASSALSRMVEEVWLEFDVCLTRNTPSHTPSVFFSVGYQNPHEPALGRTLLSEYLGAAAEGLQILAGRHAFSATRSALSECFYRLPTSARILFLGAMISRDPRTVRVVASGMSLDNILQYLRRLGVRDPVEHLPLVSDISNLIDELWLAIDIQETEVSARIGFDCYYRGSAESENNRKWADLLSFFVGNGICTEHKRGALLDAANMTNREFDQLAWPESLRRVSHIMGPDGFGRIRLDIHHVKVVAQPGLPLQAKAYLCGSYT